MTNPSAREVAAVWGKPPAEYANTVTWGWGGPVTEEVISRDLESLYSKGFRIVTIEAGSNMVEPYLSEGWFKLIRFAATEAKKRGMKIVLIDEGKYPSGFVNGKYTQERPDLRLQALVSAGPAEAVQGGGTFDKQVDPAVVSAIAFNTENGTPVPLEIKSNEIHWKAPPGQWSVTMVRHDFRTPQTRAVNDPTGAKTTANSVGDLINPEAAKLFIEWTHEQYKKHVGEFFGNTIIGFRGDEAELTGVPWTGAIADEFQKRKGYDVRKYMASFLMDAGGGRRGGAANPNIRMTDEQRRAKADYFDVWSDLFATYFFGWQGEWCEANGLQALTHLNNDHNMPALVATTGDFYRAMRKLQVPGVDVIWSQVYPGKIADFIKFPSSAAHLFGRPRSMSESFAAYNANEPATYEVVDFAVNYQMVRGINMFEFMFAAASTGGRGGGVGRGYMTDERFPKFMEYANRMTYLLAQGKPQAQIAVYMPTMSFWMGDRRGNETMMAIAQTLTETHRDFDFADEQALSKDMTLKGGEFVNLSGASYRAVIVPTSTAISKATLDRLESFAKAGGKVIFVGADPTMVVDKTFLDAKAPSDLTWAMHEPSGEMTEKVLAALPKSDVVLEKPVPAVKVMHRKWQDSDVYFFFNESDQPQSVAATVAATGQAQEWDARTAKISSLAGASGGNGAVKIPLEFQSHQARLIVIGPPAVATAQ
jgi:hypothetical protein